MRKNTKWRISNICWSKQWYTLYCESVSPWHGTSSMEGSCIAANMLNEQSQTDDTGGLSAWELLTTSHHRKPPSYEMFYKTLVRIPEGKRPLRRPMHIW